VSASNDINYWHTTTGKCIYSMKGDGENSLYCLDYNKTGTAFACAGKDTAIRVYDDNTKSKVSELKSNIAKDIPGHSNRIFAVKFTDDPNILVSGGWDFTVMIWDLRVESPVGFVYGPHISGESIDTTGDLMVTGSYKAKNVIETWSISQRKCIDKIDWIPGAKNGETSFLYSARFSPDGKHIIAGGAGRNEVKIFEHSPCLKAIATIENMEKPVTSVDMGRDGKIACLTIDGSLHILQMTLVDAY
jgi:COMPASS component SWD3